MGLVACITGIETRQLGDLGCIDIPARLEPRAPVEPLLFPFERIASGFRYMGSLTPVVEKLVFAAWTGSNRETPRKQAIALAQDRVRNLRWIDPSLAEGVHEVNTNSAPAWLVVRECPKRSLLAVHMVLKRDAPASLAKVRVDVDAMLASYKPVV